MVVRLPEQDGCTVRSKQRSVPAFDQFKQVHADAIPFGKQTGSDFIKCSPIDLPQHYKAPPCNRICTF